MDGVDGSPDQDLMGKRIGDLDFSALMAYLDIVRRDYILRIKEELLPIMLIV